MPERPSSRRMEAANLLPYEQVQVLNITNGNRLDTYVIEAPENSGNMCKALAIGADCVMLGRLVGGCEESPS